MKINNVQQNNTPQFTGKNIFVSPSRFRKLFFIHINKNNSVDYPWNISTAKISTGFLGTKDINTCTGIVMNNGKGHLQHYMPSEENFKALPTLKKIIKIINSQSPINSVLLMGSKLPNVPVADLSYLRNYFPKFAQNIITKNAPELFEEIEKPIYDENSTKLFQELKKLVIDFKPTIFEGHKNANSNSSIIHDTKNDTNYILTKLDTRKNIM